jgi:hypothetical protein
MPMSVRFAVTERHSESDQYMGLFTAISNLEQEVCSPATSLRAQFSTR